MSCRQATGGYTVQLPDGRKTTREIVEHSDCVAIVAIDGEGNLLLVKQFRTAVEKLGGFYSTPGYCSEYLYLYLATDLVPSPLCAEDTAGIKLVRVPLSQISNLIASGSICDAKSIAGLLTFRHIKNGSTKNIS